MVNPNPPLLNKSFNHYIQIIRSLSPNVQTFNTLLENSISEYFGIDNNIDFLLDISICSTCLERIKDCTKCHKQGNQASLLELDQLREIASAISIIKGADNPFFLKICLEIPNWRNLYDPKYSNKNNALSTSKKLFKQLIKIGKFDEFNKEIQKSIDSKHFTFLSSEEEVSVLQEAHCFSSLNYALKNSSSSQKVRPVSNASFPHFNSSPNCRFPQGANIMSDLTLTFLLWRMWGAALISDLSRAFRTVHSSDSINLLSLCYWTEDSNLEPNPTFKLLKFHRMTYGQIFSSCTLEVCLRFIVGGELEPNSLAQKMLGPLRFVDDTLASFHLPEILLESLDSFSSALRKYSFQIKEVITSGNWLKELSPNHPYADHPTEETIVFSHLWSPVEDVITVKPFLCAGKKQRGAYMGAPLTELSKSEIYQLSITKRIMSRLTGQLYCISGVFLEPLKIQIKLFYSLICIQVKNSWDDGITGELDQQVKNLLYYISTNIDKVPRIPRACVKLGWKILRICISTDGASSAYCFTMHIISINDWGQMRSMIWTAQSTISKHSIPCNEMMGLCKAILYTYKIGTHIIDDCLRFSYYKDHIPLEIFSDSTCSLWLLDRKTSTNQVILRNAVFKIHSALKRISLLGFLPRVFHISSELNVSDKNSKIHESPLEIPATKFWQEGPEEFCNQEFPAMFDIFLSYKNGIDTFHKQSQVNHTTHCKNINGINSCFYPCECDSCLRHRTLTTSSSKLSTFILSRSKPRMYRLLPCMRSVVDFHGTNSSSNLVRVKAATSLQNEPVEQNEAPDWLEILGLLDSSFTAIRSDFIIGRLQRRPLMSCVILAAKFALLTCQAVKRIIGFEGHKIKNIPINDESFVRIGALTLFRLSTNHFKPDTKKLRIQTIKGFTFILDRFSKQFYNTVFGTSMVLFISSKHKILIKRLFQHFHTIGSTSIEPVHILSPTYITQAMRCGPIGVVFANQKNVIKSLVNGCLWCRKIDPENAPSPKYNLTDPSLSKLLFQSDALFHSLYGDIFVDVDFLSYKGQRKVHSKCSIIILCDLFSGYVIVEFLESGTSTEVYHALLRVSRRHKRPVRIITDAGSQFLSLAKGSKIELASELGIAFQCLSPGTQFANRLGAID